MKTRQIRISKHRLYEDIDERTLKLSDVSLEGRLADNVASDTKENLDGDILARYVAKRDAMLRIFLRFAIVPQEILVADDSIENEDEFVYDLQLEDSFLDSTLKQGAMLIHEYLIHGTLYDWLSKNGVGLGDAFLREMGDIEDELETLFRGSSLVKPYPQIIKIFGRRR